VIPCALGALGAGCLGHHDKSRGVDAYIPSRRNRRKLRRQVRIGAAFCIAVDEARGGTVDAEVVGIRLISSGRRVCDVRFEVAGRLCSAEVDSGSNPPPRDVRIGGISKLRYSASSPCTTAHETAIPGPGPIPIVFAVAASVLWVGVWRLRPSPNTPMSNHGPESGSGGAR
jgi:hypothetical protein